VIDVLDVVIVVVINEQNSDGNFRVKATIPSAFVLPALYIPRED
jgi:hypothetical protein